MAEGIDSKLLAIYDSITKNNIDELRSILNPLTLHYRKAIVCQKVSNKTLLGHACELGHRDIVKYLLDECEADISERYPHRHTWLFPCLVAVNNLDAPMLVLLIGYGATTGDICEAIYCAPDASKKKYFSIFSNLSEYLDILQYLPELPVLLSWMSYILSNI